MSEIGTVNSLVSELLAGGRAKANNVVKLLALIGTCKHEAALKAAIQGLKQFFVAAGQDGLLGDASLPAGSARPAKRQKVDGATAPEAASGGAPGGQSASASASAAPAEDPEAQYRDWLSRQYGKFVEHVLRLATGAGGGATQQSSASGGPGAPGAAAAAASASAAAARSSSSSSGSVSAGVQVVAAAAVMECVRSERGPGVFTGPLYSRLLSGVLLGPEVRPEVFALLFTKYLQLADVRYFTLTTVKAVAARYGVQRAAARQQGQEGQDQGAAGEPEEADEGDEEEAAAATAAVAAAASRDGSAGAGVDGSSSAAAPPLPLPLPDLVRNLYDVLCHLAETLPPDCSEWSTWCGATEFNLVVAAPDKNESSRKRRQRRAEQQQQGAAVAAAAGQGARKAQWANPKTQKRLFGEAWLALLALPLPPDLLRKALVRLPTAVIPHMTGPHLLADFLTGCLNRGGLTGMLALNGLFLLVSRHGLEYPQFFSRLYHLLVPEAFAARTRAQFFRLADIFLSSPLVPAYTVAAFVKRFARLALTAPPGGAMVAIAFCHNLIRRHPALAVMLHNPAAASAAEASAAGESDADGGAGKAGAAGKGAVNAAPGGSGGGGAGVDPYDEAELDPAKSRAVESSLWEVEALRNHYCPQVSTFCAVLDKDLTDRTKTAEVSIEDILGAASADGKAVAGAGSYTALIRGELDRKLRKAPVAFYAQPPVSLFQEALDVDDFGGWAL